MAKWELLSQQIKEGILHGDYSLKGLPADRQLALEHDVSPNTMRRSLQRLIDEGILVRSANGRVEIRRDQSPKLQIAFLSPAWATNNLSLWLNVFARASESLPVYLRPMLYRHWDDPLIRDALQTFGGAFIQPVSEEMPAHLPASFRQSKCRIVMLDEDMSHEGLPTIRPSSAVFVHRLLDHLEAQGHREIACFNVQPHARSVLQRISQWRLWMATRHFSGRLIDEPVVSYVDPLPQAYITMQRLLKEGNFRPDAIFCVTPPAALGAMRAMHEAGLGPGQDIAIGSFAGEDLADYLATPLTTVSGATTVDELLPYVMSSLQWMLGGEPWSGTLLLEPTEAVLRVRESTALPNLKHAQPGSSAAS